jgi:phage head maturation protease
MITVQGYAIPWDKPGFALDAETGVARWENCAPNAIAAETPRNITLLVGDHVAEGRRVYAQTKQKSLRFFRDDYGLAFTAYLEDNSAGRAAANAIARGEMAQCSVNLINYQFRDVVGVSRLIFGAIDHVALVCQGAYEDTGCWVADQPLNDMPRHLRDMRMTFMDSVLENSRRRKDGASQISARHSASAAAAKPKVPESLIAMMASAWWSDFMARSRRAYRDLARERDVRASMSLKVNNKVFTPQTSIAQTMLRSLPARVGS